MRPAVRYVALIAVMLMVIPTVSSAQFRGLGRLTGTVSEEGGGPLGNVSIRATLAGEEGVLERCQIKGGNIEIHGRFLEMNRIGFVRPGQLLVSVRGAVSATIEQPPARTRFGFASGCRLRLNIKEPGQAA